MANKRIRKKHNQVLVDVITIYNKPTVQEAWDIIAEHLAKEYPMRAACYFIDEVSLLASIDSGKVRIYSSGKEPLLISTSRYDDLKNGKH